MVLRVAVMCIALALSAMLPMNGSEPSAAERCAGLAAYIWEPGFRETGIAWDKIDVEAALPVCAAAHQQTPNDPPTLFRLARIHLQQKDFERALPLLRQSAEAGYGPAQTAYGTVYMRGEIAPDYIIALRWLKLAAANGNPVAKANLATLYVGRYGLPLDHERYVTLTLEAALAGVDFAQHNAGLSYEVGFGVEPDLAMAEHWYRLSAGQGHAVAQRDLGRLLSRMAQDPSDQSEAMHFLQLAADQGDGPATTYLGWMYKEGVGVARDWDRARANLERGYALGDPESAAFLGHMHEVGQGVPVDLTRALGYYLQAAWLGNAAAQSKVAFFVGAGLGSPLNDDATALAWYLRAAAQGNVDAQLAAASLYEYRYNGVAGPFYDPEQAHYWYEIAAQAGNLDALLRMAIYYGHRRDFRTARAYVDYVMAYGDAAMQEKARHTIEVLEMFKRGQRIPS